MKTTMHRLRLVCLCSLLASTPTSLFCQAASGAGAQEEFKTYTNVRYGYSIAYPAALLVPQGEPDAGDGQKFLSKDGQASLLVWGSYNIDDRAIKDLYAEALEEQGEGGTKREVTYKVVKGGWFVISGFEGSSVFYRKTLLQRGTTYTFELRYPKDQKGLFEPLIEKISTSLHPLEVHYETNGP
jgi:hypothetical protein